jgi:hypothetical protein
MLRVHRDFKGLLKDVQDEYDFLAELNKSLQKKVAEWNKDVLCSFVSDGDCCGNNCKVSYDCGGCIKKFLQRETRVVR